MDVPIFTFHDIDKTPSVISLSPKSFERTIEVLYQKGYRTVRLSDLAASGGRGVSFPKRPMVVTFDDGYRGVFQNALPIMLRYGMTATVFVTTGQRLPENSARRPPPISGREMLGWDEILHMKRAGFDFGAHTMTHPDLTRLSRHQAKEEILGSKYLLESLTQAPIFSFAYPFGFYNRDIYEIVEKNFSLACSARLAVADENSDRFSLPRIEMHYFRSERSLRTAGTSLFRPYLLARRIPRALRLWFLAKVAS